MDLSTVLELSFEGAGIATVNLSTFPNLRRLKYVPRMGGWVMLAWRPSHVSPPAVLPPPYCGRGVLDLCST
jgi:hypothetical protein